MIKDTCDPKSINIEIDGIPHHVSYCNGFVSASATRAGVNKGIPSIKGYALRKLIDMDVFGKLTLKSYQEDSSDKDTKFKHIVFVDNDARHTKNVIDVFSKRKQENVYALYYPIAPES